MADVDLTQDEADSLIAMRKRAADDKTYDYPDPGAKISIPLISEDRRERFLLDVSRGRIDLLKGKYQNRCRQVVILARLDFGGKPHQNPDGEVVGCPHLHLYRAGYADKWAIPVPLSHFPTADDPWQTFFDFMRYCNIVEPPTIAGGLFA